MTQLLTPTNISNSDIEKMARAHAESEGDNGNAETSFKAGYSAAEERIKELEGKLKLCTGLLKELSAALTHRQIEQNSIYQKEIADVIVKAEEKANTTQKCGLCLPDKPCNQEKCPEDTVPAWEYNLLNEKANVLREALNEAAELIHSDYCGMHHMPQCERMTEALAKVEELK